jgi:hypothetical protein
LEKIVKVLKRIRFEALAGYIRSPYSRLFAQELEWYCDDKERVIGVLIRDRTDADFEGVVLGRDTRRRFRAIDMSGFSESRDTARDLLGDKVGLWSRKPDSEFSQGDERGTPMDIFVPLGDPDRLSPSFLRIATGEGFSPARSLIESMMPYYEDVDGKFVEQFQTTAFDARFWELYLFAVLHEEGFAFDRSFKAPDFFCERFPEQIFVEAVTVNPTIGQGGLIIEPEIPEDPGEFKEYYQEYMPIKWGSALTSKLKKKYWDLPHVKGRPVVFAIQDFHVPRAMTFLSHSISTYLYGVEFTALFDELGNLAVKCTPRGPHKWSGKCIETGFFDLPESEYVSAVVTNPVATISKFNRMAQVAGFGRASVKMIYAGFCHDHDANAAVPRPFRFRVDGPEYSETWVQGANVFHNLRAKYPLDDSFLVGAAHHRQEGDQVKSSIPDFHPYQSQTLILSPKRTDSRLKKRR